MSKVKRQSAKYIQHDGWSTSKSDPGDKCPKCGGSMRFTQDDDDVIFCENSFDDETCDFQYTFTQKEHEANEREFWRTVDEQARREAQERIAKEGRPVFGVARPESFVLPSAYKNDESAGW
jgi:ssDNA-binding Zn-finger/Zn-ribbon topoisomerase 1